MDRVQNRKAVIDKIKDLDEGIKRLGGLGSPHVGGPEWQRKKEVYQKMKQFGNQ